MIIRGKIFIEIRFGEWKFVNLIDVFKTIINLVYNLIKNKKKNVLTRFDENVVRPPCTADCRNIHSDINNLILKYQTYFMATIILLI